MAVTRSQSRTTTFELTSLPHELRLLVMHSMDAGSLFNFFQIHSEMVCALKRDIPKVSTPQELANETFNLRHVYTVIINREDSSWGNFEKLAKRTRVVDSRTLVVLRGRKPIRKYLNRLLDKVLTSSCLLFLESNEEITRIEIKNVAIKCEKIDLNRMAIGSFGSTSICFSKCTIHNHLVLLRYKPQQQEIESQLGEISLEITDCPPSFYDRLKVNALLYNTYIRQYDNANVLPALNLSGRIIETSSSLVIRNLPPMKRYTFESPYLSPGWDRHLGEKLERCFSTRISSNKLECILIESCDIDGFKIVIDLNAPNLREVTLGDSWSSTDTFHSQDSGYSCNFLKTASIETLELYDTYQPLQYLDSLPTVESLTVKLHENIHRPVFSCQFPNLKTLDLEGTMKAMKQFTIIPASRLTDLSINFLIESGQDHVFSNECKKLSRRISMRYPKLEALSVRNR